MAGVDAALVRLRADLRRRARILSGRLALNDEAILAGAVAASERSPRDLRQLTHLFDPAFFNTNPPHLFEACLDPAMPAAAIHPVVTLETVLARLASGEKTYSRHRLRRVLSEANDEQKSSILERFEPMATKGEGRPGMSATDSETARFELLSRALRLQEPLQIVDVGANPIEGEVSYQSLLDRGLAHVTGFEPQEDAFAALNARKSAKESYYPDALGDGTDKELHLFRESGFTSVYPADPSSAAYLGFRGGMTETGRVTIRTSRLDTLKQIPRPDMLKIDVQGSEAEIIANGHEKLSSVLLVQTEVRFFPLYEGEPRFGDLERELHLLGLELYGFDFIKRTGPQSRYKRRLTRRAFAQAVDGDAWFVRDLRRAASFADSDLAKLALLADSVMRAFDLALFCLDHLETRGRLTVDEIEDYIALLPANLRRRH